MQNVAACTQALPLADAVRKPASGLPSDLNIQSQTAVRLLKARTVPLPALQLPVELELNRQTRRGSSFARPHALRTPPSLAQVWRCCFLDIAATLLPQLPLNSEHSKHPVIQLHTMMALMSRALGALLLALVAGELTTGCAVQPCTPLLLPFASMPLYHYLAVVMALS